MTHLLQNLNFNEDDINLILTDDATVNLVLWILHLQNIENSVYLEKNTKIIL